MEQLNNNLTKEVNKKMQQFTKGDTKLASSTVKEEEKKLSSKGMASSSRGS